MTMVMTFAVRALSLFLVVWLTVTAAIPACCWSMAYAHEHEQASDIPPSDAMSGEHHHDHHENVDSGALDGTAPVLSSISGYNCDAEFADAATILRGAQPTALRPIAEGAVDSLVPALSAHDVPRSDTSPPGSTFTSAFLSPLRI